MMHNIDTNQIRYYDCSAKRLFDIPHESEMRTVKAKFHYAIWSQTGPKLVADLQRAGIWPIIAR